MKEVQEIIRVFKHRRDEPLALATLVRVQGSSYRQPGARMLIASDRSTVGALSGGCLEEEVALRAQEVIATGRPALLTFDTRLRYGCNGSIEIFVERVRPQLLDDLGATQAARGECLLATVFEKAASLGSEIVRSEAAAPEGAFCQTIRPPLQLLLIGQGPDSPPLCALAAVLGWKTIEVEEAATLPDGIDKWTAAVVKTHNYGRDYTALEQLLPRGLRYVALLGPRQRRDQLLHTLLESGVAVRSELFSPAGLGLGAESPEEIALAIVAEIQATFAEAPGDSLRQHKEPIHQTREFIYGTM